MEQELRSRRDALIRAVNTQNHTMMPEFVASTYQATLASGQNLNKQQVFDSYNRNGFQRRYREKITIRSLAINGEKAELHVTREARYLRFWPVWLWHTTDVIEEWMRIDGAWMLNGETENVRIERFRLFLDY